MADYLPKHKPGQALTMTTSAAVTGGRMVTIGASGTVATSGAGDVGWLGVADRDATASGQPIGVYCDGVQRLTVNGAVTFGTPVKTAATGKVAPWVSGTDNPSLIVGIAILSAAADGDVIPVKLAR